MHPGALAAGTLPHTYSRLQRHLELLALHKARNAHFDFERVDSVHFHISFSTFSLVNPFFGGLNFSDTNYIGQEAILQIITIVHKEHHSFVVMTHPSCSTRLRFKSLFEAWLS